MSLKSKLLSCVAMLAVVVGIVVVGVLAASSNDFLFQGDVSYAVADKSLYVKDVQYQHGMSGEPVTVPGFRAGYINNGFELNIESAQISENTSGTFVLYFDIVNLVVDGQTHEYVASADWTGEPVSGVTFSIDAGSETIAAGTVTPANLTDSTPVSGRVGLEIRTVVDQSFDLSNITVLFSQKANENEINATPDASGGVVINDYTGSGANVVIPDTVGGQPVTSIGSSAFANNTDVTTVTIPETVTKIDASAFYQCSNLTTINLPKGLTEIGDRAFYTCGNLTDIVLPEGLTKIGGYTFFNCQSISGTLNIPASVTEIGQAALTLLGLREFTVDADNEYFATEDGVLYNIDFTRLLAYPRAKAAVANYAIRESVLTIDDSAFRYCFNLSGTLTLPPDLQKIGKGAFFGCSYLTGKLAIPSSLTAIEEINLDSAFRHCQFTAFEVETGNSVFMSEGGALYNIEQTELICYPAGASATSFVIPSTVTTMRASAIAYCDALTSIILPQNLQVMNPGAIEGCPNLTGELVLPNTITQIESRAMSNCGYTAFSIDNAYYKTVDGVLYNAGSTHLISYPAGNTQQSFAIPNGITTIYTCAFYSAKNLISVTMPSTVKWMNNDSFLDCTNLKTVTIDSATIAAMLSSRTSAGYLIQNASTLYISENAAGSLPDGFFTMFSETPSERDGYRMYVSK